MRVEAARRYGGKAPGGFHSVDVVEIMKLIRCGEERGSEDSPGQRFPTALQRANSRATSVLKQ